MRFALFNNKRVEAEPKLKGQCPGCLQPVTAKCGTRRNRHWAHLPEKPCADRWWEPETLWHRAWKDNFPLECQEFVQYDTQSGEKHIADVRTKHGLVIEFQHSHLDPQERAARERFYGNMVWVVNGTRLKRMYQRFRKGMEKARDIGDGFFLVDYPEECFPPTWLERSALVFFDFRDDASMTPPEMLRNCLWCLLPNRAGRYAVAAMTSHKDFVEKTSNLPRLLQGHEALVNAITAHIRQQNAAASRGFQQHYARRSDMVVRRRMTKRL